jgi:hypothetical protein
LLAERVVVVSVVVLVPASAVEESSEPSARAAEGRIANAIMRSVAADSAISPAIVDFRPFSSLRFAGIAAPVSESLNAEGNSMHHESMTRAQVIPLT